MNALRWIAATALLVVGFSLFAAKPAATVFASFRQGQAPQTLQQMKATTIGSVSELSRRNPADKFAIYVSTLSGDTPTLIFSDPRREVNHARISPDGNWVVFARYNRFNRDGEALEVNGYLETEVIRCRVDGSDCEILIPSRRNVVSANAYWSPDGKKLLYVTNDTPRGYAGIKQYDTTTNEISLVYVADDLLVADPHQVGGTIVMPGRERTNPALSQLYLLDATTKGRRQLTFPKFKDFREIEPPLGDHDPKLSPDGKKVAVMRHMAQDEWHIVVVNVGTGAETDLSAPGAVDAVPEWSSDSQLLIFWSVDRRNLINSGLYTIRPDGSERKRVPLPRGYFYTMPAFAPGGGSGAASRIVYSTQTNPKM